MKFLIQFIIFILIFCFLMWFGGKVGLFNSNIEVVNASRICPTAAVPVGQRDVSHYTLGREEETDSSPCHGRYGDDLCQMYKVYHSYGPTVEICASNEFPENTVLVIGDNMKCIVKDTMNSRYKNRIDIATMDYEESRLWGVQVLDVSVVP